MTETINERWFRWDKLFNAGKYQEIIKEFDAMVAKKGKFCIGDLVRRDDALEKLGIASLSGNAKQKRKNERFKKAKS